MCAKLRNLTLLLLVVTLFSCTSKKDSTTELKLISWNCNNFLLSLDTLHVASAFLNAHNPDIISLQERPHTNLVRYDSIKKCFPTLPYKVTNGREDENLNISIFSKYPISNVKTWYFKDTYNKMIQTDINQDGKIYRLFNVHMQTTSHGKKFIYNCIQRYKQSNLLKHEIKKSPYPVIICGDFNDIPLSYTITHLLTTVSDKSWSLKGSFQKWGNIFKIDYIFSSNHFQRKQYVLHSNPWSDHKIQQINLSLN